MKDGWYWVKRYSDSRWEHALLEYGYFSAIYYELRIPLCNIAEIGDYIETPEKYR